MTIREKLKLSPKEVEAIVMKALVDTLKGLTEAKVAKAAEKVLKTEYV